MKTTLTAPNSRNYPCLMRPKDFVTGYNGYVILMTEEGRGTVVHALPESINPLGLYSKNWDMSQFEVLPTGSKITIET